MVQLQGLEEPGAVNALAQSDYSLLVLEPMSSLRGNEDFDTVGMLKKLRTAPGGSRRILLAYIDIGEAEDYRVYWGRDWRKPSAKRKGSPSFILSADPDGWSDNYPVAYWDERWKKIWLGESGWVRRLARAGFDGVYLDWVEAYDQPKAKREAKARGLNAAKEMIRFIEQIGMEGKKVKPDFLVIPQNALTLLDRDPNRYLSAIDGLGAEDTWFRGSADASWENPMGGDLPNRNSEESLAQYRKFIQSGMPVFSLDYCLKPKNAEKVYREARKAGLRPLVTRVSLSRLTVFPPPPQKPALDF